MPRTSDSRTGAPIRRVSFFFLAAIATAAALAAASPRAKAEVAIEAVDRSVFRVCADPNNPPFSKEDGSGFENKIAELFAKKLGRPLVYKWSPKAPGFYNVTLNDKVCDVVMGVPAGISAVLNTNPYYRMTYVMAYLKKSGLTAKSLADPAMKKLNIGVVAGTPPNYLIVENGLLDNMRPYQQLNNPGWTLTVAEQMMKDLKDGKIDVAVLAGPPAYYWAKGMDAEIVPLENAKHQGGKMDYLITMGVRLGERDWKQEINELIKANQAEIDKIIESYGIPVLNLVGPPVPKGSQSGVEKDDRKGDAGWDRPEFPELTPQPERSTNEPHEFAHQASKDDIENGRTLWELSPLIAGPIARGGVLLSQIPIVGEFFDASEMSAAQDYARFVKRNLVLSLQNCPKYPGAEPSAIEASIGDSLDPRWFDRPQAYRHRLIGIAAGLDDLIIHAAMISDSELSTSKDGQTATNTLHALMVVRAQLGVPVIIKNDEEFLQLKPGMTFIGPDMEPRIKNADAPYEPGTATAKPL